MSLLTGASLPVIEPATGAVIAHVEDPQPVAVEQAVAAAAEAHHSWAVTPADQRAALLRAAADRLVQRAGELTDRQVRETGRRRADAATAVDAAAGMFHQYAELGPLHRGRSLCGGPGSLDVMRYVPRGVAAVIVPWNDPVAIAAQGIAANLAAGNTVVLKPSERAPFTVEALAGLVAPLLPAGVLGCCLGGPRTGEALVEDRRVDVVVHTGSAATGRRIAVRCAALGKKAVLELGGKDPLIVDEGVDVGWAAEQAAIGAFANAGQICVSTERIYVHRALAEPFVEALVERARHLRVGDPFDETTEMGPLIDEEHLWSVAGHVDDAVARGARVLTGGQRLDRPGCYYPPTVLTGVDHSMPVMREETFGPVAPVQVVSSFDEALTLANDSRYGLAACVLTPSMANAQRAVDELQVGTVKVNAAFGGAPGGAAHPHRESGNALGYGPELLDELTRVRVAHLEPAPHPG
jgi:acyl-CoA reductase-like NAD-dependent aldehyde dehydrogenase